MIYKDISEETIIEFHKRFAAGEQYIEIDATGEIVEIPKNYYWEEREVFNIIGTIIDSAAEDLSEDYLYGKGSLVERLIPVQRSYNKIKNKELEYINRISVGVLCVEDGSVDIDELEEEGVVPGKPIVYRQGSLPPTFTSNKADTSGFIQSANEFLNLTYSLADAFIEINRGKQRELHS